MSCETYFNIFNLQGSSFETEVGWSTLCVPNGVKFGIMLTVLIVALLVMVTGVVLFVRDWQETTAMTLRKKVFLFVEAGLLAQAILLVLNLAGVQSRARYLLGPLNGISMGIVSGYMVQVFVRVFSESISHAKHDGHLSLIQKAYWCYVIGYSVYMILFYVILCMVYYDDPFMLNWFYSLSMLGANIGASIGSASFILVWHRMAKLCEGSPTIPQSPDMKQLHTELTRKVIVATTFTLFSTVFFAFPAWMGVSGRDSANPGMQGHFYYHFCYFVPYQLSCAATMMWIVLKSEAAGKITTGSHSTEDKKNSSSTKSGHFASFTVEELNGS